MVERRATLDDETLARLYAEHVEALRLGYDAALAEAGFDGVLIHAGVAAKKSAYDDQYWPLRPTPHFQHWLPLAVPDCAVLVRAAKEPILFHNVERSFWEGPPKVESQHFWSAFSIVEIDGAAELGRHLSGSRRLAFVGESRERAAQWGLAGEAQNPEGLLKALDQLRTRKSRYERECIRIANERALVGHTRVADAFAQEDLSELELHLMYLRATWQDDAETPYKNIVALGKNASILHHIAYERERTGARSLLVDAGATYLGYHSDITRTWVKGDEEPVRVFRELVRQVERMQGQLIEGVKVGMPYEELHDESHRRLAPLLRDAGICRGSVDELVETGITRKLFPHGLGHSLGLQTHDVGMKLRPAAPENPFLRNTSIIEEGQVFTIEPGCYFTPMLLDELRASKQAHLVNWTLVDALTPLGGVRIEDNIAVENGKARNLTRGQA